MAGFRHIVLLTFRDDATAAQVDAIRRELHKLPEAIPEIENYVIGSDAGLADGNASMAVVADFASADDYIVYRDHPAHRAAITEHIAPVLEGRSAVQHEL